MFEPFDFQADNNLPHSDETPAGIITQLRQVEAALEVEESLILYGAPTLLGLKCASLFTCSYTQKSKAELGDKEPKVMYRTEFESELASITERLAPFGVSFDILAWREHGALLFMYRPVLLTQALRVPLAHERLCGLGYCPDTTEQALSLLKERLREFDSLTHPRDFWDFPHEIGHFLGYDAADVEAYTRNRAHGFHCRSRRGAWFVYGDKAHMDTCAQRFSILNSATTYAYKQHSTGTSLEALAAMGHLVEGGC